jgi:ceramide glucosyltransferase
MVETILGAAALLSAGINIWQWLAARRFPLHARAAQRDFAPGLTLFKPLKGADDETPVCLESWLAQDYSGPVQILFGVADPNDPVCEIVRDLKKLYPDRDVDLVICNPILGANAKVSTLTYLESKAKHPFWVVSDADVFAPEDLLSEIAHEFRNDETALVNCFYKLEPPASAAMLWESVAINADFWSQVCQSNSMKPMDFALGAVMAARRTAVEKIGGFRSLLNQLADDYQLGHRIAATDGRIRLSSVVVECREKPKNFREVWKHQLRWARTIRVCQPVPYFMSILANMTLWTIAWIAVNGVTPAARVLLILRVLTAMSNQARLTDGRRAAEAVFAPIKDLLQFAVWVCAFSGSTVTWRGETFRVLRDGELVRA